jgi:hypothetical protein
MYGIVSRVAGASCTCCSTFLSARQDVRISSFSGRALMLLIASMHGELCKRRMMLSHPLTGIGINLSAIN